MREIGSSPWEVSISADFEEFGYVVRALPGRTVSVELERDGQVTRTIGEVGERLTPAGAAAFPGVEPGDRVVAVDGRPVAGWAGLGPAVEEGKTYRLEVRRYLGGHRGGRRGGGGTPGRDGGCLRFLRGGR